MYASCDREALMRKLRLKVVDRLIGDQNFRITWTISRESRGLYLKDIKWEGEEI
jgi:hypothetical protein